MRLLSLVCLVLLAVSASGCGAGGKLEYASGAYGCSFSLPGDWEMEETGERQGVLTLRIREKRHETSYLVITVFPAGMLDRAETADKAEQLLRQGLFSIREPLQWDETTLASGRAVPLLAAQAGQSEPVQAVTAVLYGSRFNALATLIAAQEHFESYEEEYLALLESFQLK